MTSAEGQVPVRVRGRLAAFFRWDTLAAQAAEHRPRGGAATWSAFAVLGAATLTALGLTVSGIDSIVSAAARNAQATSAEVLPAAARQSAPARAAAYLALSRTPGQDSLAFSLGRMPGKDGLAFSLSHTPRAQGLLFTLPGTPGQARTVFQMPESPPRQDPVVARSGMPSPVGLAFALPEAPSPDAPAVARPETPPRLGLVLVLPDAPPREDPPAAVPSRAPAPAPAPPARGAEAAWREARALPEQSAALVRPPAPALAMPEVLPASEAPAMPLPKPDVATRGGPSDVPPPVVYKPRITASAAPASAGMWPERNTPPTIAAVSARFNLAGYDLAAVRSAIAPVPRVYLEALPSDLSELTSVAAKKRLFVQAVLPIVLKVNEEIAAARWRAQRLGDKLMWADPVTPADRRWLEEMAERYGTAPFNIPGLLHRMDIVPPSLGLAQAALESGWGTSRFVREGNALFGQYTYESVTGMVPERRDEDRRHRIRRHDTLLAAARSYVHNLNTHAAYEDFRERRARLRGAGRLIGGYDLAGQLEAYSERRAAYVEALRRIMRQNRLGDFDRAWLNDRQWTAVIRPSREQPI